MQILITPDSSYTFDEKQQMVETQGKLKISIIGPAIFTGAGRVYESISTLTSN